MGTETEYDDPDPPVVCQTAGYRSAQRLEINLGERSLSMVARASFVSGICAAICVFCAGVAWWSITEHRVTQSKYDSINAKLEKSNAK